MIWKKTIYSARKGLIFKNNKMLQLNEIETTCPLHNKAVSLGDVDYWEAPRCMFEIWRKKKKSIYFKLFFQELFFPESLWEDWHGSFFITPSSQTWCDNIYVFLHMRINMTQGQVWKMRDLPPPIHIWVVTKIVFS